MDLKSQLENIFPNHKSLEEKNTFLNKPKRKHFQDLPLLCKYEKRKGKPITIIEGFISISINELKLLARDLKQKFSVGGTVKNSQIIIQGDIREKIMGELVHRGYKVKRVGG